MISGIIFDNQNTKKQHHLHDLDKFSFEAINWLLQRVLLRLSRTTQIRCSEEHAKHNKGIL